MVTFTGILLSMLILWLTRHWFASNYFKSYDLFAKYAPSIALIIVFTTLFNMFDTFARVLFDSFTGRFLKEFLTKVFFLLAIIAIWSGWVDFDGYFVFWLGATLLPTFLFWGILVYRRQVSLHTDFGFPDKG
ncbi:MAG: hypothetical protein HC896_06530 [Bacteroidales bacterium]|nr:hypothetical protein [Bacteroidales bacterium]